MLKIDDEMKAKIIAQAKEMLKDYDGKGIDIWHGVMYDNGLDGFDMSIFQEDEFDKLSVIIYPVYNLNIDLSECLNLTEEVLK